MVALRKPNGSVRGLVMGDVSEDLFQEPLPSNLHRIYKQHAILSNLHYQRDLDLNVSHELYVLPLRRMRRPLLFQ